MCGLVVVLVAVAVGWIGCQYYDGRTATDDNDASVTVQQAQRDNQSAIADIGNAAAQIDDAQSALDGGQADIAAAAGRVNELQSRADADAAIIADCQGSLMSAENSLQRQEKSLQMLTEKIKAEEHKAMVARRQRDTYAVLAGVAVLSVFFK